MNETRVYGKKITEMQDADTLPDGQYVMVHKTGEEFAKRKSVAALLGGMAMEFVIKTSPSNDNPLEQPVGNTLTHPSFAGRKVGTICYGGATHTRQMFNKPTNSDTLTLDAQLGNWAPDTIIIVNFLG